MPMTPQHGQVGYVQIPALDVWESADFYHDVFGWHVERPYPGFEAPGLIGQWVDDRPPSNDGGPVLWISVDRIDETLRVVEARSGTVVQQPTIDNGERWLATITDPAGNTVGIVQHVRSVRPQPLVCVRDVEAATAWYQQLFGFRSDHGGQNYERLVANGALVLQLHQWGIEHDHGAIGDPDLPHGNGALLWFEVDDFDAVVERATRLDAHVVMPVHRNPPDGEDGGPAHRELWLRDLDGYTVVVASRDGESPLVS